MVQWPINSRAFRSMSSYTLIPEIQVFPKVTKSVWLHIDSLTFYSKPFGHPTRACANTTSKPTTSMASGLDFLFNVIAKGHKVCQTSRGVLLLSFHVRRPSNSCQTNLSNLIFKVPGQGNEWDLSHKQGLMPIDSDTFHSMSIGLNIPNKCFLFSIFGSGNLRSESYPKPLTCGDRVISV